MIRDAIKLFLILAMLTIAMTIVVEIIWKPQSQPNPTVQYIRGYVSGVVQSEQRVVEYSKKAYYHSALIACFSLYHDSVGCLAAEQRAKDNHWWESEDPAAVQGEQWKP